MTVIPSVYYALLPGAIGYFIVSYSTSGFLNAGTVLVAAIAGTAAYMIVRHGGRPAATG